MRMHLTVVPILLHKQVEVRLRRVVETIADAADGHAVGLLLSNVRLGNEHLIHLTELLGWMRQLDGTGGESGPDHCSVGPDTCMTCSAGCPRTELGAQ